jgi:hypothetical protein
MKTSFAVLFLAVLAGGTMKGQDAAGYLDVFTARVKPEKRTQFDAINKTIAALNRRNKGDNWLAAENFYGEWNTVTFTSLRSSIGDTQKAFDLFLGALAKPGGMPAAEKIFQDFNNTLISSRTEIRRRRPDLSSNVPPSPAEIATLIGKSRFLYMVTVRVRPGRALEFEDQIKMISAARAKSGAKQTVLVSQSVIGVPGTNYYITIPLASMADIDGMTPVAQTLGSGGYKQYQKGLAENTVSTQITIARYLPELSNPPADIIAADQAFWNPKPPPMKKAAEPAKQ